ncbi:homocysteine-responsive endoplasmic reticulum-resident ubiquitin-like domain member 2 protein [Carassius carassius]|uniref:homocysteine-responsive endoplasmic reticulum-resident ubiquitin-like domain member 2 protein n=1 Tax=Carassius carassius TaxID=217509 RepID=UPI002868CABB|nr:homocysteine-responsive endoplasmic reticulum-resident ubiquitin-like domain member 2 protein [Carassius carassius]
MEQGTFDSPVTLVIKAPNQKYDDQTINCFLNWTVEKLKKHISKVYPSKPSSKDQRLVYSGRLLQDHLQLRDVLRKQDEYHMVHLVCASQSPPSSPTSSSPASTTDSSSSMSDSTGPSSSSATPSQETPANSDGLRHRGNPTQTHGLNPAPTGVMQRPEGMPLPLQGGPAAGFPAHPMYMPMQMFWWQQMYARHYYMQYHAAMAASRASSVAPFPTPSAGPTTQPARPNEPAAPMGEDRPANPNIQMNAQGGAMLNDDELNRDWLDWMYTVSRAAILLSIVYFYSSFGRFVVVIGAMLLVYLHQAGWFPFRAELQNPEAGEGPQDEAEQNQDMQEMERMMDEGMEDDEGDSGEEGPEDPMNTDLHQPGFLSAAWSFISTFFTSLIPEGPPQAAN